MSARHRKMAQWERQKEKTQRSHNKRKQALTETEKVTVAFDFPTLDCVRLGYTAVSNLGFRGPSIALQ